MKKLLMLKEATRLSCHVLVVNQTSLETWKINLRMAQIDQVITVPAYGLTPLDARPSGGTVMNMMFYIQITFLGCLTRMCGGSNVSI